MTLPSIEVLTAKQRRLAQLELRAGREGYDTPPQIANEIKDLQREIAAAAPTSVAESHAILYDLLQETRTDVRRLLWFGVPIASMALTIAVIALVLVLVLL
jgi:hypothetical protein